MVTIPTPEESALEILAIFVHHFKCRPEDVLQRHNFELIWLRRKLVAKDFAPGIKFAAQQGWIEILRKGASFMLMEAGFAKV
jgi:hypothetical protein